ncbi:MAG: DUF350 domain-containing protein [Deltaproteobacteria bacterium]|jgi:uncharacterized membrane protein YjfL (UPF0719 family)|nr:DUF350 domain-containing protein [Deltaproteobacteria bacterium]
METNIGITILNLVYATLGAVITLIFMVIGYKTFDKITPFDTHVQLEKGNIAVGIVIGSIFVGLGIAVGLVVGLGLN